MGADRLGRCSQFARAETETERGEAVRDSTGSARRRLGGLVPVFSILVLLREGNNHRWRRHQGYTASPVLPQNAAYDE